MINTSMKGYGLSKSKKDKYFDYYIDNGIECGELDKNFRKYLK
jgi:hypothetical protein